MKTYVLVHDGLFRNLIVTTHDDRPGAEAWLAASKKVGGEVVGSPEDLAGAYSGPSLVILYNTLGTIGAAAKSENLYSTVAKFETKKIGAARCFKLIEELFANQAPEAAAPPTANEDAAPNPGEDAGQSETTTNEEDMAKGKKKKAPKAKKAAGEGKDEFGLRKGSKSSQAAAMFSRANGSTMAKAKEALGDTFYGLLGKLEDAGHKVKKDGKTIYLTAK